MAIVESTHRPGSPTDMLDPGSPIEVQNRFTGSWCRGFEIAETVSDGAYTHYRIRRTSDGTVIPDLFGDSHVRPRR